MKQKTVTTLISTYKLNIINGFYLPALINSIIILFNWQNAKGADKTGIFIILGILGSWLLAVLFNYFQYKFTKNHDFGKNELYESIATGCGALISSPLVYFIFGESLWQLLYFFLAGLVTVSFWAKSKLVDIFNK